MSEEAKWASSRTGMVCEEGDEDGSVRRGLKDKISARKTLKAKRAVKEDPRLSLLAECARNGWTDRLEKMLESDRCPVQAAIDSSYLLAAEFGQLDVVKMLLPKVSSMNYVNKRGDPAILLSSRKGHIPVTKFLVEKGISIETRDANGDTPLLVAVEAGKVEMTQWLIEHGADVNAMDDDRNSVLHVAAIGGNSALVRKILEAGAAVNVLNDEDETPIEVAKNSETIHAILDFSSAYQPFAAQSSFPTQSPFRELSRGPASYLFWASIGVGKDNYMFQKFGVYPYDRLNDTERILILTEVAECICGYRSDLQSNILYESTLYAVFSMMKIRTKKEIDISDNEDDLTFAWRKRVLEAYEQLYETNVSTAGISVECCKLKVWNAIINSIARHVFGELFWEKKRAFSCPISGERRAILASLQLFDGYFDPPLPTSDRLSQSSVQLTFKKLLTMSKNYLNDDKSETYGCYCQECIAEREVPLSLKLQFLEETAEERKKLKKKNKGKHGSHNHVHSPHESVLMGITNSESNVNSFTSEDPYLAEKLKCEEVIYRNRTELQNFWASISTEEKWSLTEFSINELNDIIYRSKYWETLRAAQQSYTKYSWDDDRLEISEECVTITDDVAEVKGCEHVLNSMLDAVAVDLSTFILYPVVDDPQSFASISYMGDSDEESKYQLEKLNEEEWDHRGRRVLETLVLAEFARKIAAKYILKKEESRAQRIALELELELLQEEEKQMKAAEKKAKKKKSKNKKKNKSNQIENRESEKKENVLSEASAAHGKLEGDSSKNQTKNMQMDSKVTSKANDVRSSSNIREDESQDDDLVENHENNEDAEEDMEVSTWEIDQNNPFAMLDSGPSKIEKDSTDVKIARHDVDSEVTKDTLDTELDDSEKLLETHDGSSELAWSVDANEESSWTKPAVPSDESEWESAQLYDSSKKQHRRHEEHHSSSSSSVDNRDVSPSAFEAEFLPQPEDSKRPWFHHPHGMMFICTDETFEECMQIHLLGLPKQHLRSIKLLQPFKSAIFLFNISTRMLHGIYEASGSGGENLNVSAWSRNRQFARSSPFPAQIPFQILKEFPTIPESSFRHMFPDGNRIRRLDAQQVRELVNLFSEQSKPAKSQQVSTLPTKSVVKPSPAVSEPYSKPKAPVGNVWQQRIAQAKSAQTSKKILSPTPLHLGSSSAVSAGPARPASSNLPRSQVSSSSKFERSFPSGYEKSYSDGTSFSVADGISGLKIDAPQNTSVSSIRIPTPSILPSASTSAGSSWSEASTSRVSPYPPISTQPSRTTAFTPPPGALPTSFVPDGISTPVQPFRSKEPLALFNAWDDVLRIHSTASPHASQFHGSFADEKRSSWQKNFDEQSTEQKSIDPVAVGGAQWSILPHASVASGSISSSSPGISRDPWSSNVWSNSSPATANLPSSAWGPLPHERETTGNSSSRFVGGLWRPVSPSPSLGNGISPAGMQSSPGPFSSSRFSDNPSTRHVRSESNS